MECLQDADSPCLTKSFNCEGELKYRQESSNFEVISVFCNPEEVEDLKSEDELADTETIEQDGSSVMVRYLYLRFIVFEPTMYINP